LGKDGGNKAGGIWLAILEGETTTAFVFDMVSSFFGGAWALAIRLEGLGRGGRSAGRTRCKL
jgi:hypothetical protein